MNLSDFDPDVVIDARYCVLGRVASEVAQRALDGEKIAVVNAEEVVITGDREDIFARYRKRQELGSDRGPNYPRRPDAIFKRSVRGMLPMKRQRGREALSNVRVFIDNPFDTPEPEVIEDATLDRLSTIRFIELGELSQHLGATTTW